MRLANVRDGFAGAAILRNEPVYQVSGCGREKRFVKITTGSYVVLWHTVPSKKERPARGAVVWLVAAG